MLSVPAWGLSLFHNFTWEIKNRIQTRLLIFQIKNTVLYRWRRKNYRATGVRNKTGTLKDKKTVRSGIKPKLQTNKDSRKQSERKKCIGKNEKVKG